MDSISHLKALADRVIPVSREHLPIGSLQGQFLAYQIVKNYKTESLTRDTPGVMLPELGEDVWLKLEVSRNFLKGEVISLVKC